MSVINKDGKKKIKKKKDCSGNVKMKSRTEPNDKVRLLRSKFFLFFGFDDT